MTVSPSLTALSHAMAELSTFARKDVGSPRFSDWHKFALSALIGVLGEDAPAVSDFRALVFAPPTPIPSEDGEAIWRKGKAQASALLTAARFHSYT